MKNVRKIGKVYEYKFVVATFERTGKWITKSDFPTKAEAFFRETQIHKMS